MVCEVRGSIRHRAAPLLTPAWTPPFGGMSGLEVLRTLREKEYNGGVIILTSNHREGLLTEAWAMGPQEVLGKPVDLERLLTAVQLVMVCREC